MCAIKSITNYYFENVASLLVLTMVGLFVSACGAMDPSQPRDEPIECARRGKNDHDDCSR